MSAPQLFDVHTHTQFAAYAEDRDAVIQRALDAGVWMINVGTQKDTSHDAAEIAKKFSEGVYASVGLHPIHTGKSFHDAQELGADKGGFTSRGEEFDYDFYLALAQEKKVVAIGECGLDYYRLDETTKYVQRMVFERHIMLAREVKKPMMIHCRNAFSDLIDVLEAEGNQLSEPAGVIHFFTGTKNNARNLLDLGFSFSFGGVLTFARDYDEVVAYIPIDRMVSETDAPYITPVPYRGKRNEPSYVIEAVKKIAELKQIVFEEAAEVTTANARKIFAV